MLIPVALRKESVDRNMPSPPAEPRRLSVALRKESVDRNVSVHAIYQFLTGSLSARRAWIEIRVCITITIICTVALRKESVDRN